MVGISHPYLEEFLSEAIPAKDIEQAVKNKTAMNVLGNLRKVFAIDSVIAVQIIGDTTGTEATVCVGRGQRQTKE